MSPAIFKVVLRRTTIPSSRLQKLEEGMMVCFFTGKAPMPFFYDLALSYSSVTLSQLTTFHQPST